MRYKRRSAIIAVVAVLILGTLLMDIWMMFGQIRQQTKNAGVSQLESTSRELENTIAEAENLTTEIALEAREYIDDKTALEKFIRQKKRDAIDSDTGVFNVYIAGSDWYIIPDFKAPKGYDVKDRIWYKGAIKNAGKVNVTPPYKDLMTSGTCYSVSVMLGDGDTVLAVDYTMNTVQSYIETMYDEGGKYAVIVTDDGIIAGCSNEKLVGRPLSEAVPEYSGIWSLSKKSDGFVTSRIKDGLLYENLFASRSDNGWYLIVSVNDWELYRSSYIQLLITVILVIALLLTVILAFILDRRHKNQADKEQLGAKEHEKRFKKKKSKEERRVNKKYRNRILVFMILLMIFSLYTNISATYRWGNVQMQNEADKYEYKLAEWVDTQKSILDMFTSTVSTNPEMIDDYDRTVDFLDKITDQYPQISVSYIANPKFKPTVYMNNGWKPGKDWQVDERPWYKGAMESKKGWSITAPYYDAQTGGYCITFSEKVKDAKTGRFIGVFGIDFYMDKLVDILGDSYSDKGYAFLVDTEGVIVNHPYGSYQMSEKSQTSVLDLPYGKVKPNGEDTTIIKDYDGSRKIVLATVNETSKFSVYVVSDAWMIYGRVIIYGIICFITFLVCMVMIYRLLSRMIAWQDEVNRRLEKAAQTDAMTGLMNKASTEAAIERAVKKGKGSLLVIDLDNFKLVNDIYGHDMGDRVLIHVSDLIKSVIRDNDIAGRIGGDEFVAFCEGLTDEEVLSEKAAFMNREIMKAAKEFMASETEIPLGCSVGVVMVPDGGREYSVLFSKVDQALHQAKKGEKHKVCIYREQEQKKTEDDSGELSRLQMVFGERNVKRSAMVTDRTMFRDVYRFMMRFAANCACDLYMVVFDLQSDDDDIIKATDHFVEMSAGMLRSCDVVLEYNKKQVLLLLVEADEEGFMKPIERIMEAWAEEGDPDVTVTFHHDCLNSRQS